MKRLPPQSEGNRVARDAMTTCVALLRGINVGKAKRVAMTELRDVVESAGGTNVRTLLNSGNVVFDTKRAVASTLARKIEAAIEEKFGFTATVVVVSAAELDAIVEHNPLPRAAAEPARYLIAFFPSGAAVAKARSLLSQSWAPEAVAVGDGAAYLWCADGIIASKALKALERATGGATTTRNWTTVLKLQTLVGGRDNSG